MTDLIHIEVRLHDTFRRYAPGEKRSFLMEVQVGSQVAQVMELLSIPAEEKKVLLLNGRPAKEDALLEEGDTIVLFSPVAGG